MKTRTFIAAGLAVHARTIATTRHLIFRRACLWTGFLALATIAFGPQPAQAAVTEAWVHRYSNVVSNAPGHAVKVVLDAVGDIIVTGNTDGDLLTIKYSGTDGSVLWQQSYNGPANSYDSANALAVDGSGNVVVTGSSYGANSDDDYYTAKYAAADGALLWEKRYNRPASSGDYASALAMDGSGNVVVTGSSDDDYYTAKYAAADGALLWEKRYNGPASSGDYARALAVDGSGNVVVTGSSNGDYYTAKYAAADSALVWEKRYSDGQATALAVDGSGNVVVTGGAYHTNSSLNYYTAKYAAADGTLLWEKRYNRPENSYDSAKAVAVDGSGNVVVTGSSNNEYYTAKYAAADGALLWEKRYNRPENGYDSANAVAVDSSGNVMVTGSSSHTNSSLDYYTAKYSGADGSVLWEKRYNGSVNGQDEASALAVDGSGNVVVAGTSNFSFPPWPGGILGGIYHTAKYAAADGALLWEKRYNGSMANSAFAHAVAVDGSGNVAVTGIAYNRAESGLSREGDYYTAKYAAANGALLWEKRYDGPANYNDTANAVAMDASGNVVVTGSSHNAITVDELGIVHGQDYYTAKYAAADGTLLWEKRYNGPANSDDGASALAVDGNGNVVVTGTSNLRLDGLGFVVGGDYYTAKYAAADGTLLWEKRYDGPANGYDRASAVALDASGNVVVTGFSYGTNGNASYTVKYAAADGALLWEKRDSYGQATAVAVDGSGNVVVTGFSEEDYYTAKYAAADGALLWEKRYNGLANSSDIASAVAVDLSGNVVVTGYSYNATTSDYYTAKYAAADGTLLWGKRYDGPANGYYNRASAVALDASGNVVVTGYSQGDYYTAKYAAADGALLWEKRYNGPANGDDSASSLALGPNGMIAVTGSSSSDFATVVYREVLPAVSIDLIPTGVRLRFTGVPGRSYNIERAPAVTGPWSTINTQTAPPSGLLEYLDINSPAAAAFYRTSEP